MTALWSAESSTTNQCWVSSVSTVTSVTSVTFCISAVRLSYFFFFFRWMSNFRRLKSPTVSLQAALMYSPLWLSWCIRRADYTGVISSTMVKRFAVRPGVSIESIGQRRRRLLGRMQLTNPERGLVEQTGCTVTQEYPPPPPPHTLTVTHTHTVERPPQSSVWLFCVCCDAGMHCTV